MDIRQVLPQTRKLVEKSPIDTKNRVLFHEQNILDPDWQLESHYDLVILSNIVHAYAEEEISGILKTASQLLSEDGILLIHDFFLDHWDLSLIHI